MKQPVVLCKAGLSIERVALVTGHKDWKMLRRYTHLKPEDFHKFQTNAKLKNQDRNYQKLD